MKIDKKKLNKINQKYINANNIKIFILFIPLLYLLIKSVFSGDFSTDKFLDVSILVSFIIVFICETLAEIISHIISAYCEDSLKLTEDYDKLICRYLREKFYKYNNIVYTIKIICDRRLNGNNFDICIDCSHKNVYYELPKQIKDNSAALMKAHDYSVIYNNLNVRIDDIDIKDNCVNLLYSKTYYYDSLITNRVMDYDIGNHKTIRDIFDPGPFVKPLNESKLSNHLGFNGFVELSDGNIIFVKRSKNVSVAKNMLSTSISASYKTKYGLNDNQELTIDGISNAIRNELRDELKINVEVEDLYKNIFAFYRDIIEGGKPQFCFYIKVDIL